MNKISFVFIACAFLVLPFGELNSDLFNLVESIVCAVLIGTFGISHGAIDNHLYGFNNRMETVKFIIIYVLAAVAFGLLWIVSSNIAFVLFVLISAYHFGQSQFIDYTKRIRLIDRILFLIWGLWLLSAFVFLNKSLLFKSYNISDVSLSIFNVILQFSGIFFLLFSIILLAILSVFVIRKKINLQEAFVELYQLFIIIVVFRISSPLLGFTLYFVILHSIRVLEHEFHYIVRKEKLYSKLAFIRLLMPFTIISLLGLGIFALSFMLFDIEVSFPVISIIFISCLTFPHSIVMDLFYKKNETLKM